MTYEFTPRHIRWLLTPSWLGIRNRYRNASKSDWIRIALFAGITLLFALGVFAAFYKMLTYLGGFYEFRYSVAWGPELSDRDRALHAVRDSSRDITCFRLRGAR